MKKLFAIASLSVAIVSTGCINHHETVYRDSPRAKIDFENDKAGKQFYETLSMMPLNTGRQESHTEVSIPIVFSNERTVYSGPNEVFNNAVAQCDANHDGTISEKEAAIFLASKQKNK